MTECEREAEGLPRVGCVEMRCGLLTSSTRSLHTRQWAVLQPISPPKASSDVDTSTGLRNGRTGNGPGSRQLSLPQGPGPQASVCR